MEEVGGREDRGSYWVSLILSFVSLWIAFVYTVSSGQEFHQQACVHVGIFTWRVLLLLLTRLSNCYIALTGGLEVFNPLRALPLCGRDLKAVTWGQCVNEVSDEE